MRILITQSMLFPWPGLIEQVRLADAVVHYDDVQFSKGSFVNRVQIKTASGTKWMTVPLTNLRIGQSIDEVEIAPSRNWRTEHLQLLARALEGAPYVDDALKLAKSVYRCPFARLGELSRASFKATADYFGLASGKRFVHVSELGVTGKGSERVLKIVLALGGTEYLTGHGARNYLDHAAFEASGVSVHYIDYDLREYPQLHGKFTPYVSSLDLIANCGLGGLASLTSKTLEWRQFIDRPI